MSMNNIKITNLPENTSPSLSGITVVVDNEIATQVTLSDIKDLILSGFSGGSGVITTTYTNLQSLITSNELNPGTLYKITGFNRNMPDGSSENPNDLLPEVLYNDGTNSGVTIYLRAITTNTLSESGHGEFYNPKYYFIYEGGSFNPLTVEQRPYTTFRKALNGRIGNNILNDYMIMHSLDSGNYYLINFTQWTQNNNGGGFSYTRQLITPTMTSPIITFTKTNGGNQVDIIEAGVLEITRGNNGPIYNTIEEGSSGDNSPIGTEWSRNGMSLYNITGGTELYGIWDGDNPVSANTPNYQVNQVVFWGGYAWKNLTGNKGSSLNVLNLDTTNWQKLPYSNSTYYEKVIDEIKVDLNNGILIGRTNVENQITVEFNAAQYEWQGLYSNIQSNPISVMGWGLYSKRTPEGITNNFYGISNVKVINSFCETVNFKGEEFTNVEINSSRINSNYFGKGTYFTYNTLTNSDVYDNTLIDSSINNNTLTNQDEIYENTLTSSNINGNMFTDNSDIQNNTLFDSNINDNTLTNDGNIENNTLTNSSINDNTLTKSSNINNIASTNSNVQNNTLTNNSSINSITLTGSNINDNTLTDNSDINDNTLTNSSGINNNSLTNSSEIYDNTLTGSNINRNSLTNSSEIYDNTLTDNSSINDNILINEDEIYENTLTNSNITYNTLTNNSDINGNLLTNGSNIGSNILTSDGNIYENTLTDGNIQNNTLTNSGEIYDNRLTGSSINSITLTSSNVYNNTLTNSSNINNNTLTNSNIDGITLTSQTLQKLTIKYTQFSTYDLSASTDIFLDTEKTIFTRLDGTKRLMYYNTGDTPTIVDVDA
jgi:hypothetical protein